MFDIQSYINMMLQLAAQRQQQHTQDSVLGTTATSNSRPSGLTPKNEWNAMFPGRAARVESEERNLGRPGWLGENRDMVNYRPPTMSFADAAVGASQPQPYAAALRAMPAQSPFVGVDPRMDTQPGMDAGTVTRNTLRPPVPQIVGLGESDAWAGGRYRGPRRNVPNGGRSSYVAPANF